jgi:rod shape-determining protein MreC
MPPTPRLFRRLTLLVLLASSLGLITGYFREGEDGPLHGLQRSLGDRAAPVEGAVQRVAEPFRDAGSWASGLADARSERDRLRRDNARLREELADGAINQQEVDELRRLLTYTKSTAYRKLSRDESLSALGARVLSRPPQLYAGKVRIDVGRSDGVALDDPVLAGVQTELLGSGASLIGRVTGVTDDTADVTLLSDTTMAVAAMVVRRGRVPARGILQLNEGNRAVQRLEFVLKRHVIAAGDLVVTSGYSVEGSSLESIFPRGLPIGRVTQVSQTDTENYKSIQVTPWVDLESFTSVLVLRKGVAAQAAGSRAG